MSVDKKVSYDVQGGVKNYLGKQKEVTAPLKWQSSPEHPKTELAYITEAEKDLLVKRDLHGSLKGGVNRGPSGIMSLNGFGSTDESQNVSGSQMSAAESGNFSGFSGTGGGGGPELPPGVDRKPSQLAQDIRSAAIAAGAGQRVNPGFFDSRNTVSPIELARARAFNPTAFKATRGGGLMNLITGGGFLGNIIRGLGQRFGLGKTYDQPTYDMRGIVGSTNPNNLDIYNEFVDEEDENEVFNLNEPYIGGLGVPRGTRTISPGTGVGVVRESFYPKESYRAVPGFIDRNTNIFTKKDKENLGLFPQIDYGNPNNDPRVVPEEMGLVGNQPTGIVASSDVAPEFQNMIMRASGTIGNYSQNAVSNQLYGKDYAVLDPFEQQQIDKAIETYGTKSTGELASGTDV